MRTMLQLGSLFLGCVLIGFTWTPPPLECKTTIYVEHDIDAEDLQPKIEQWENLHGEWQVYPVYTKFTLIVKVPCKGLAR